MIASYIRAALCIIPTNNHLYHVNISKKNVDSVILMVIPSKMELYHVLLYFISQATYFVCPSEIIGIISRASFSMTVTAPMRYVVFSDKTFDASQSVDLFDREIADCCILSEHASHL